MSPEQSKPAGVVPPQRYGVPETAHRRGDGGGGPTVRRRSGPAPAQVPARRPVRVRVRRAEVPAAAALAGSGPRRRVRLRRGPSWWSGRGRCGSGLLLGGGLLAERPRPPGAARSASTAAFSWLLVLLEQLVVAGDAGLELGDDAGLALLGAASSLVEAFSSAERTSRSDLLAAILVGRQLAVTAQQLQHDLRVDRLVRVGAAERHALVGTGADVGLDEVVGGLTAGRRRRVPVASSTAARFSGCSASSCVELPRQSSRYCSLSSLD